MGRTLKRVSMDFDWPMKEIWPGYQNPFYWGEHDEVDEDLKEKYCEMFKDFDPPTGEGFQLWETTSEGSPISPVFKTLEELCEWCAENATTFGSSKASKEEWMKMLNEGFVRHEEGNLTFI